MFTEFTAKQLEMMTKETSHKELLETIETLEVVNFQLAQLKEIKERLEVQIVEKVDHNMEGQKKYNCGKYAVTVKSGFIYSLDKDEYQIYKSHLQDTLNPVREKISYEIDKKHIKEVEKYASAKDLEIMSHFINKKPAKVAVSIKANV